MKNLSHKEQFEKAFHLLEISRKAPFYAEKYKNVPRVTSYEEWCNVPMLTRDELYKNTYPASTDMFTGPLEDGIISSTGGSSGIARTVALTNEEWDAFCDKQAEALALLGIKRGDLFANLFVAGHLWPSFLGGHEIAKRIGAVHLPISANIAFDEIYRLCRQYNPTVMISLPTLFVFLADLAKKDGYTFPNLRVIAYAGEQLSKEAEKHIRKYLGVKEVKALAYSSADCGLMGYQCSDCGFGTYHVPTDFQLIEIVDPDTLQPVSSGQTGEVVVTNLCRELQPIIRYRIGDMATFLSEPCSCDDLNSTFCLAGRAGEDFKLGGAYISMDVFDREIANYDEISINYRLILEDIGNQMNICIEVESDDKKRAESIIPFLKKSLEKTIPELRVGQESGYIKDFSIRILPLSGIERSPITGKIKKMVDKRVL